MEKLKEMSMDSAMTKSQNEQAEYWQKLKLQKRELYIYVFFGLLFIVLQLLPMYVIYAKSIAVLEIAFFAIPVASLGLVLVFFISFKMRHRWSWTFVYVSCSILLLSYILFGFCINR